MVILVSVLGVVWHPPTPPKLGGDGSCGYQILPTSPSHEKGKKLTHLLNVRVKQLSFSQKWSFWCWYWGWFDTPQLPQNSVGTVHVGIKFCPQVPPTTQGGKMPWMVFVRVKLSNFSKKNHIFGVKFWGDLDLTGRSIFVRVCSYGPKILTASIFQDHERKNPPKMKFEGS